MALSRRESQRGKRRAAMPPRPTQVTVKQALAETMARDAELYRALARQEVTDGR